MAVTRINTNQINDAQVTAAKIAPYTLTGGLFSNTITLNSNISIIGNLDITGNTTTVNSVNTYVNDPIITFNNGYVGVPSYDVGMLVNRNLGALSGYGNYNTAWIWDETNDAFAGVITTETGNTPGGTIDKSFLANLRIGNLAVDSALTTTTLTIGGGLQNTPVGNATPNTGRFTYLTADTGFSTANAVISGGYISALTNAYVTTSQITDFSTGNAVISGGYLSGLSNITATTGNVSSWYTATLNATNGNVTTLQATDFSTGNAVISGGYITALSNATITTGNAQSWYAATVNATNANISTLVVTNFSTGNAVISGGYINNLANLTATTAQFTNVSTANAVISGGYVNNLTNLTATTTQTTNFSTGNAVITGGYVNGLANLTATTTQTTNFSTGNAVITGGYVNGLSNLTATTAQFTNVSTANAVISGGYISALTNATITTGNAGSWYATTVNATNANITTLAATNFSSGNAVISGGYADNFAIGANTAGPASFTTANTTANLSVGGDLSVTGNAVISNDLYAANIITTGTSGNISGVDYLLTSNIIATGSATVTGNVSGSWFNGNVKGTTGNLTTVNANLITASYTKVDNYLYANGEPFISTTIANTAEITANVAGGQNVGLSLTATGVSAGNYGSAISIPTIVVDNKGRVTSITTNAASTGFALAANTGTGSLGAGQILTIYGTAAEVETSVSGNAFTIGLPNDVNISTLYATNFSSGNIQITGGNVFFPIDQDSTVRSRSVRGVYLDFLTANIGAGNVSTSTTTGAVTVDGGLGMTGNLNVGGNVLIVGNLTVQGNTTTVGSQDLIVADSIIRLHTINGALTSNDGRDIGVQFRYYDSADSQAFLGRTNNTGYLEWYARGSEDVINDSNVFVGTAYGTFKTGSIILANATPATAANTGALQVWGGASVSENLYVGNIFAAGGNIGVMSNVTTVALNATTAIITDASFNTLTTGNLSTGNAVITGGYINGLANLSATTTQTDNLSTANAVISGGYITALTNATITTGNVESWYAATINATTANIATAAFTTLSVTNFSSGNVVISGGYLTTLANIDATRAQFTSLSTGNAVISGGYINGLSNVTATTAQFTNISTGNAVISGGYADSFTIGANTAAPASFTTANTTANLTVGGNAIVTSTVYAANIITTGTSGNIKGVNYLLVSNIIASNDVTISGKLNSTGGGYVNGLANLTATTTQTDNLSTANAVITGGYVNGLANLTATTTQTTNFSTGNAWIAGGNVNGLSNLSATTAQITNLSSGNAVVTGGSMNNVIIGNTTAAFGKFTILNATANVLLSPQDSPGTVVINPLNIGTIDNMTLGASYQGNAYVTNFKATQSVNMPALNTVWIRAGQAGSGSAINNIKIGSTDPATGVFTTMDAQTGNLTVLNATEGNVAGTLYAGNISSANIVVAGPIKATGNIVAAATTSSTSTTTGALVVKGGAGIAGDVKIGTSLEVNGGAYGNVYTTQYASVFGSAANANPYSIMQVRSNDNVSGLGMMAFTGSGTLYGNAVINFATATIRDRDVPSGISTKANIDSNGLSVITGTTSTSTGTGALVVVGGAGIGGNLNIGSNIVAGGNLTLNGGLINSAGNIVINSTKSAATDFAVRGKNENSLIYAISSATYDQVIIGGNIVTANATQGAKLTIDSTDSMLLPIGASGDRPGSSGYSDIEGMFRYNSTIKGVEFYDGTNWISPSTTITIITDTQYSLSTGNPAGNVDGTNVDFTLPSASTTNGCIVSINGVLQLPTSAYSVGGPGALTLTFTEAPALGDIIDVRILSTTSSISQLTSPNGLNLISIDNGNIIFTTGTVGTGAIDQWHIDTNGDFIPQTSANIGDPGHRVDYLFASNINIAGGSLSGVSISGTSFDGIPIGGNIPSTGGFTSVITSTLQVNAAANFGDGIYLDDSQGYSVLSGTTGKIDSFDKNTYRSGKYFVQLTKTDNTEYQAAEIIVVHNGTTPVIEVYGVTFTGAANLATFSANISGSTVNINATASADVNVKAHPVLMKL